MSQQMTQTQVWSVEVCNCTCPRNGKSRSRAAPQKQCGSGTVYLKDGCQQFLPAEQGGPVSPPLESPLDL